MTGLAIAGLVVTAVGTGVAAYSQYQEGEAQADAYNAKAAQDAQQARLEQERANIAQIQGEQEASHRSRQLAQEVGHHYAAWAGNGLLVDGGSGTDTFGKVLTSTAAEAQADISTIKDNTSINVWNHLANKQSLLMSASANRQSAASAKEGGRLNALGTVLGGAGRMLTGGYSLFA